MLKRLSPKRNFLNSGLKGKATALMFWRWGFSDILSNTTRGVLAEFLVAWALGIHKKPRLSWTSFDLEYKEKKIEVKSTAYLQTWDYGKKREPSFQIKAASEWNPGKGYGDSKQFNADIYVLCFLHEKNRKIVNPMNLKQWTFWLFIKRDIQEIFGERKSVSIDLLEKEFKNHKVKLSRLKIEIESI